MTVYSYTGRSTRGDLVSGTMEGDTRESVAGRLRTNGVAPIDIAAAVGVNDFSFAALEKRLGLGKPSTADLVLFSRQLYTITKSGLPLLRGLRGLATSTHNTVLREVLEDILLSLQAGRDLAASFGRHPTVFPPLYISIVSVGESTGTLQESFLRLSEYLAQDQDMRERVKGATRYPIIVVLVIAIAVGFITTFVIPRFAPIFRVLGDDIPLPTRIIIGLSEFVQHRWYLLIGIAASAFLLTRRYVGTVSGRYQWDSLKLRLPVFGKLTLEATLARISRSLSISLKAGMPMIQTLNVIAESAGNVYMADRVRRLREQVERGEPLSSAATTVGMFPPLVLQMMAVGEETGELSELLDEVAGFYEREVDYSLKNLSAAIEPILIGIVGGMVLVLALGIFLPLWEMISKVSGGQ
jgi:MSHA biogenesis protein MshG